jgi:branched-chain amino acid aminotransferase
MKFKNNVDLYMWNNGIITKKNNNISSFNFSLHYSSPCVWEGIRSYKSFTKKDTNIVALTAHIDRLYDSAKIVGINIPFTKAELIQGCKDLVRKNGGGDLYLRPVVYAGQDAESISNTKNIINVDIYVLPIPKLHGDKLGISVGFSSFTRGYPQFQMQAKSSGNYVHTQLCTQEKEDMGVDDLFLFDNQGYITEALVANVFVVKNGVLMTPPNDGSILPGITRYNVFTIFNHPAFKAKLLKDTKATEMPKFFAEKKITRADILTADEVFLCGTYAEIVPVIKVAGREIGDGSIGRFTEYLKNAYSDSTRAKNMYGISLEKA